MKPRSLLIPALMLSVLSGCTTLTGEQTSPAPTDTSTQPTEPVTPTPTVPETPVVTPSEPAKVEPPKATETKPAPKPVAKPAPAPKPKPATKTPEGKLILGSQEWVYLSDLDVNSVARIDTGATTSSISAIDVVNFERDGKDWVKFKLSHDQGTSKEISLPVTSKKRIRQSNTEELVTRYSVEGWIQVGDLKVKTPFTLTDRTHMDFAVLLGRTFFRDVAIVDVSRKFVQPKVTSSTAK